VHAWQDEAAAKDWYVLIEHRSQASAASAAVYLPGSQATHCADPMDALNFPGTHAEHSMGIHGLLP